MAFGIYKPGQGYWVRALTAVAAGILVLAMAGWGWAQAGAVRLPIVGYDLSLQAVSGSVSQGDTLQLLVPSIEPNDPPIVIATGVVTEWAPRADRNATVSINQLTPINDDFDAGETTLVQAETPGGLMSASVNGRIPESIVPQTYVQAGVVGLVLLGGAISIYWFIGLSRKTNEFLIATDGEMKKVNWSTKKEVIGSTQVVIVATFLISAILFVIDIMFRSIFEFVGVLQ